MVTFNIAVIYDRLPLDFWNAYGRIQPIEKQAAKFATEPSGHFQ